MRKSTRRQTLWSNSAKQIKRIVLLSLVALLALSVPAVSNVVSTFTNSDATVVHAETSNYMNVNEILTSFMVNYNNSYEHWSHTLQNNGDMNVNDPDFDLTNLKYVVKFPNELSHLLEDDYVLDYLFGRVTNFGSAQSPFNITGTVIDENGEQISISKDGHRAYEHISINHETNSLEFDFDSFYTANNLEPYIRQNLDGEYIFNALSFSTPILVPDVRMLHNGTYEFKTAIVRGDSVDLDDVANAYRINLEIDYSTDPEPEPEDPVDTAALEELLVEAADYDEEDYTEESYALLLSAIAAAEAVLADEDASQDDVDEAVGNLESAIAGLVAVEPEPDPEPEPEDPVDTSALEELLAEAADYDEEDYTEESYGLLLSAIAEAEAVLTDEDATQEDVDEAVGNLESAIAGLVAVEPEPDPEPEPEDPVDTSALEELLVEAADYDEDDYTEESYTLLLSAIAEAEAVLTDEDATQDDVNEAVANLDAAIEGLVAVEPEPQDPPQEPDPEPEPEEPSEEPSEDPEEDPKEEVTIETDKDDKKKESVTVDGDDKDNVLPKTSTTHFNWLGGGLIMILLGTAGLLIRKRRTN